MNPELLRQWLARKKRLWFWQQAGIGLSGLLAGAVILFLTFWFTYAIIWIGWEGVSAASSIVSGHKLHLSHGYRLAGSGLFLILLFVQHFRTDPWHWGDYPQTDYNGGVELAGGDGLAGSFALLLAHPGASANMIADILLSGPRLVVGACKMVARGFRIRRLDEDGCAQLLLFLYALPGIVPYGELTSAGWEAWLPQLRCIDGVNFLPKGLLLSSELRNELNPLNQG